MTKEELKKAFKSGKRQVITLAVNQYLKENGYYKEQQSTLIPDEPVNNKWEEMPF
jgi:hypothetical protein